MQLNYYVDGISCKTKAVIQIYNTFWTIIQIAPNTYVHTFLEHNHYQIKRNGKTTIQ